jgi:putative membrane protein
VFAHVNVPNYYFKGLGMEYFFEVGFLGTRAPYYMDGIVVYLLLLPIFIVFSISLAIKQKYKIHRFTQTLLFILTVSVLLAFNYGIYMYECFDKLMAISSIGFNHGYYAFIVQITLSLLMFILWLSTILFAIADRRRRALPGLYSKTHKKSGHRVFVLILSMILSIIYLYWIFYIA